MSEDENTKRPIIIKKVRKLRDRHRDTNWRPASAHYLAAMIPFLLLAWLLAMASPPARQAVVDYFHHRPQVSVSGDNTQQ